MKVVFIKNGLVGGGLEIMAKFQAEYFYNRGIDVTILIDKSYSKKLMESKEAIAYKKGIKIIPVLTSNNYLYKVPEVKRRAEKEDWFGGTISKYYDEYGILVKTTWHDSNRQRVKISIPIVEEYLKNLKKGDIVITMEPSFSWYLANLKLPYGVSKMVQMHNQHFFLEDWIDNINKVDAFVCLTPKTKEFYEKIYGKKDNIFVLPNLIRSEIPTAIKPHKYRKLKIVSVGRLEDVKQPYHVIKAFEKINMVFPNSTLEFYGNGKMSSELKSFVKKLDISEKIFFKGYESNLEKIFSDASLMILTSKRESFGLVIIEAFAYGVPVVAYSTSFGVDDLIDNNKDGYIVEQGNIDEIIDKSISLLRDNSKRDTFGKHGHDKITIYQYDIVMQRWFNLIKNISKKRVNDRTLKLNILRRMRLPTKMYEYIALNHYSNDDLDEIIKILEGSKIKIVDAKAYIYSFNLIDNYNMPLDICEII
jgi:glycosyltransferase involved in cell wall biosynthesis